MDSPEASTGMAPEGALDRNLLLRLRGFAADDSKPLELGLCQAQIDVTARDPETEDRSNNKGGGNKGKNKKTANTGAVVGGSQVQKQREGRPSTEGGSGGTSGQEFPWRRGRSADGEGGSGSAPSGFMENAPGTGATPTEYPWRRSPPSPELGPQSIPWRKSPKSPQDTSALPSPTLSGTMPSPSPSGTQPSPSPPGLDPGDTEVLEFEMSVDTEKQEPFSALTTHTASIQQNEGMETTKQLSESEPVDVDLDAEEFESGEDESEGNGDFEQDECAQEEGLEPGEEPKWKSSGWKPGWKNESAQKGGPALACDLVVSPSPPPPLQSLAGTWFDSLGNMIQVPLYPPIAWFTNNSGSNQRELSLDKWGRLWCGNGVLHQVGYNGGPLAQDMPPTHLSWRTTAWKFSIWERVATPPVPPPPPSQSFGKGATKGGGQGGSKRTGGTARNKGTTGQKEQAVPPPKPELPKLGDFMSFPALGGKAEAKKKSEPKVKA